MNEAVKVPVKWNAAKYSRIKLSIISHVARDAVSVGITGIAVIRTGLADHGLIVGPISHRARYNASLDK